MVRAKKKQKRLDAIVDSPSFPPSPSSGALRRSSRERRAPVVLDSSPVPSHRKKRPRIDDSSPTTLNSTGSSTRRNKEVKIQKAISFDSNYDDGDRWISRQRENTKGKTYLKGRKKRKAKFRLNRKNAANSSIEVSPVADQVEISSLAGEEGSGKNDESLPELNVIQEEVNEDSSKEKPLEVNDMTESENLDSKDQINNPVERSDPSFAQQTEATISGEKSDEKVMCKNENVPEVNRDAMRKSEIKEGRRCGLCGGGIDGRPPKILVRDLNATHESDKEAYEGLSGSEEPNYDVWDGFGDEPGWLGRLLGPIRDQYGISRIWVHQNCAVWSPEV